MLFWTVEEISSTCYKIGADSFKQQKTCPRTGETCPRTCSKFKRLVYHYYLWRCTNNVFKNLSSCYQIINNGQNIGVLAPGVIFDREIALKIGGIRYEYWPADDVDLSNRIVESGYIVYSLPEVLMLYRLNKFSSMFSFKSFIDGKKKSNWVKYNLLRRKSKKKEFSFKKFLLVSKKQTYFLKLISNLNYTFDFLFRLIPYYILKKNYLYFFLIVLISLLINPLRFLRKIKDRYN